MGVIHVGSMAEPLLVRSSSYSLHQLHRNVLNASFNKQQHHSLQDCVETSAMLQYNKN